MGHILPSYYWKKVMKCRGIIRRSSNFNTQRIEHIYQDTHGKDVHIFLHYGDMVDASNLSRLIEKIEPDEIYNLAEMIKIAVGFKGEIEWDTSKPDGTPRKLLDISRIREKGWVPKVDLREGIIESYKVYAGRGKR